jgi:multiple sugar transport system substrate-binding protein
MKHVLMGTALAAMAVTGAAAQEVSLGRFFGACEDAGTDTTTSTGEACIIQSIINAADAELDGITVNTLPTDWGNYYDQIVAAYAGGEPPDVHVMHRHRVPQFAGLGALAELSGDLEAAGIDVSDWAPAALDAVSYNGGIYGVPMDFHANLWHVNMEIMEAAGLVNDDGSPILPTSPAELLEHAAMVEDATGHDYLAADFAQFPIGVRLVLSLMWQQGENIFTEDGTATIDTEAARNAVTTITQLFDEGYANPQLNYADSQQAFLNGEAAVLVNGTWVVDFYAAEAANPDVALSNYYVADFPTLFDEGATWADSHM